VSDNPPSTVAELRDVLIAYDASRPRSMQTRLGPSELGTPCQQQMARKLAGAPRRAVTEPLWAPFCGTAVHAEMEKVLEFWNASLGRQRWFIEDDLTIDEEIRGRGDAFDNDLGKVCDWKYAGKYTIGKVLTAQRAGKPPAQQVSQDYRIQAHLYGRGHELKGRTVRFVSVEFLARDANYDLSAEWVEEYKPEVAFWAIDRYYAVREMVRDLGVDTAPDNIALVPANPGEACFFCPFRRDGQRSDWGGCQGKSTPWP
jgi:hypothetical protein